MADLPDAGASNPFLRGQVRLRRQPADTPAPPTAWGLGSGAWSPLQAQPDPRTPRLSANEARRLLAAPDATTLQGKRDRAILAIGLYLGATRTEIAALRVRDFQNTEGFECLRLPLRRVTRRLPVPPIVARRLEAYLVAEGHAGDPEAPLFRVVRRSSRARHGAVGLRPAMIDQVVRKYTASLGLGRGYGVLSLRATYLSASLPEAGSGWPAADESLASAR